MYLNEDLVTSTWLFVTKSFLVKEVIMVTLQKMGGEYNRNVLELVGKSGDLKPTDTIDGMIITNGSTFYELNTKKVYMFDYDTKTWIEQ